MRLRSFIIIGFFLLAAGILVWIYFAATPSRPPRTSDPWVEITNDLDRCGRYKASQTVSYQRYADIAAAERNRDAERLWRALSRSEQIQRDNCIQAIKHLGGSYHAPEKIVVFRATTPDNIRRSSHYKRAMMRDLYLAPIGAAMNRGNRYAARILIWAAATDRKQVELLEEFAADSLTRSTSYRICPTCGNPYTTVACDIYCPLCLTNSNAFIVVE